MRNGHVVELLRRMDSGVDARGSMSSSGGCVRDVALGGDHTLVLSSNKKDVVAFGKGGEGQLGLSFKPWVSSPARSKVLSSSSSDIAAVCAFRHCSWTLDEDGEVKDMTGKCDKEAKGMIRALKYCEKRARESGLLNKSKNNA